MRFYSDIISIFVGFKAIIWVLFRKKGHAVLTP